MDEFAATEGIGEGTAWKLSRAASKAAVEAYQTTRRLALSRSKDEERDRSAVSWWLQSIPDYWDEPTVSPDFQALLSQRQNSE